jgi:hypothetical protein
LQDIKGLLSIFLTGLSIKLMDDYLDQELDKLSNKRTMAIKLERASLPYTLLLFSLAVALNYSWSLSLFWASYILGMGYDLQNSLPTGLKSYQESVILLILSLYILEPEQMFSSLLIIFVIQLIDDLIDYKVDKQIYRNNFIYIFGKWQVIFLIIIMISLSLYLDYKKSILVLLLTPLVTSLLEERVGNNNEN